MTEDNQTTRSIDRRTFLKTSTVAATLGGVPLVSASTPLPSEEVYAALAERRSRGDWDIDQWRHQLDVHGFDFKYTDEVRIERSPVDDGISTNRLDKSETRLYITYTSGSNSDWVNFEWSLNDGWGDYAAEPPDYIAIAFDGSDYDRTDYGPIYNGDFVKPIVDRTDDTSSTGVVAKYNSNDHAWKTHGRFGSSLDIGVEPESGSSSWSRQIHVDYYFTAGATLSDIDIDGSEVDLDFDYRSGGDVWKRSASAYEYEMDNGDTYEDT